MKNSDLNAKLDAYYREVKTIILDRQHPTTGLLPASTAVNIHGDYTNAWVRDNVYSIQAVWGLALAYRKVDSNDGRAFELEHAVVKLMRGLLFCMMKQADKVEAFKESQSPLDALHAKYNTATGDTVVGDDEWGHLQLDATSLYLLMLAQMTASGLSIIYSQDEVNFIQNLVFYIGRTYRTPDYGIWERGDKTNHGLPELNASSIAMAKAALEALSGFNLFGVRGSQASVIHVLPDEIAKSRITLEALLPRESSSKEVDAALLSAIGFPAFSVEDKTLVEKTRNTIITKLEGRYGLKRFLRDGHQTVLEDIERLHYEPEELKQFEHLESEWPLFYTYLLLDSIFADDQLQISSYLNKLKQVAYKPDDNSFPLLPELYYVPLENVEKERQKPGSQDRVPNENLPLVWAQSLYILGRMLVDKLISCHDIDPLGRHQRLGHVSRPVVQLAIIAQDEALQQELAERGVRSQTPEQIKPIELRFTSELANSYYQIGRNDKLGLTGRPVRRLLSLSTSRIFKLAGNLMVFPPALFDQHEFYLSIDPQFLVERLKGEIAYIHRHWSLLGRPTVTLLLTHALFNNGREALFALMDEIRSGQVQGVPVKLEQLSLLMKTANIERIDNLHDYTFEPKTDAKTTITQRHLQVSKEHTHPLQGDAQVDLELESDVDVLRQRLRESRNLYEQVDILASLVQQHGLEFDVGLGTNDTVRSLLAEVYDNAIELRVWAVIRQAAGLLNKVDVALSDSVSDILVSQKSIVVGKAYTERSLIDRPLPLAELLQKINEFCRDDSRDKVFTQELLVYLGILVKAEPELFRGFLTVRVGHLILLLTSELAAELGVTQDEAYERLMHLPPSNIQQRLRVVLASYTQMNDLLRRQESIQISGPHQGIVLPLIDEQTNSSAVRAPEEGWWRWRKREGVLNRVPPGFYPSVWQLMSRCHGLVIGDKLERRNRLDSQPLLSEMTAGEKNFALRIELLLSRIPSPEYRQLSIEALTALARVAQANPALRVDGHLVLDILIGHAVRFYWTSRYPELVDSYDDDKASAWAAFYELSPAETSDFMIKAFQYLLEYGAADRLASV